MSEPCPPPGGCKPLAAHSPNVGCTHNGEYYHKVVMETYAVSHAPITSCPPPNMWRREPSGKWYIHPEPILTAIYSRNMVVKNNVPNISFTYPYFDTFYSRMRDIWCLSPGGRYGWFGAKMYVPTTSGLSVICASKETRINPIIPGIIADPFTNNPIRFIVKGSGKLYFRNNSWAVCHPEVALFCGDNNVTSYKLTLHFNFFSAKQLETINDGINVVEKIVSVGKKKSKALKPKSVALQQCLDIATKLNPLLQKNGEKLCYEIDKLNDPTQQVKILVEFLSTEYDREVSVVYRKGAKPQSVGFNPLTGLAQINFNDGGYAPFEYNYVFDSLVNVTITSWSSS